MDKSKDNPETDDDIIKAAIDFMRRCEDADGENRREALEDLRFRDGQQWPADVQNSRQLEQRPCLTINRTDAAITMVENQQRQQRPRIKVDPTGGVSTKKVAEVYQGLIRHIENHKSGGDLAYDTGFSSAVTMGFGFWRVLAEYCRDDSFDQDLYIAPIDNPFSVYFDPSSIWPDGSDAEECLITDMLRKREFRSQYPGKDDGSNFRATGVGDGMADWLNADEIRVAEYYRIRKESTKLVLLSDGTTFWADRLPPSLPPGITIVDERPAQRRRLCWYKLTALEVLERRELPGRYIPVVPMYGSTTVIDGKRKRKGMVRNAKDPARVYNFWQTSLTESVALAPKAKWLMAEGQDEGFENEWAAANLSAKPVLHHRMTDVTGNPAPPPQRLQPEPPPQGVMAAMATVAGDLTLVLGVIDPALRIGGNVSGKALNAERQQSDTGTFNYYDNMTRSIAQTGRILVDLIPHYYNQPGRIARIIGDDGRSSVVTLNEQNPSPGPDTPGPVEQILNDVTVGEYAIVMDTGPGFSTKRQEAVTAMMPLFQHDEKLMATAGDVMFRNMDFPGAEVIADRLAATNPVAQIDEKSEIPPGVQMKIKQQEAQIKEMQQALQAAQLEIKHRGSIEQMKQDGATQREHMKAVAAIHIEDQENAAWQRDVDVQAATKRHDTETRAITALNVAEINAVRELLKTKVNNSHDLVTLDRQAEESEREVTAKSNQTET